MTYDKLIRFKTPGEFTVRRMTVISLKCAI